jgi:hypothetical protein
MVRTHSNFKQFAFAIGFNNGLAIPTIDTL